MLPKSEPTVKKNLSCTKTADYCQIQTNTRVRRPSGVSIPQLQQVTTNPRRPRAPLQQVVSTSTSARWESSPLDGEMISRRFPLVGWLFDPFVPAPGLSPRGTSSIFLAWPKRGTNALCCAGQVRPN